MLLTGVVYLIIDTYYYFIIPMREWTYLFTYYEIVKEYREYKTY